MSRRTDLEGHMHASYEIIREYERMILTSGRPEERQRARDEVSRQWAYIKDYLAEYQKLVPTPWPDEIAELAAHFAGATQASTVFDQHEQVANIVLTLPQIPEQAKMILSSLSVAEPSKAVSPGEIKIGEVDGKEMVYVPAGVFLYGDNKEEKTLDAFWIDRTPVTNAEYARFVAETGHEPPEHWKGKQPPQEIANHSVVYVSWYDARDYARWAGKQLPTEEQWEKAARGTDGRTYPWGDEWRPNRCNTNESGFSGTTPVGRYSPAGDSPYGCVDMVGNVWEWTASEHERFKGSRVVRGGAFDFSAWGARCACRGYDVPNLRDGYLGFRVVASPVSL